MKSATKQEKQAIDPICGMTVDPARAAGKSERGGETYYFCSSMCKEKFDAGTPGASGALTQIERRGAKVAAGAAAHVHHAATMTPIHEPGLANEHGADVEKAQERAYRVMMRKFWFAAAIGIPLLLLMFAELIPAWREALMPYHRVIGMFSALLTLPVLVWSGSQFFTSAWNGFRNHNTNMDTLVALGTGAAWMYSAVVVLAPHLFPSGTAGMYFEVAVIVIALILLGQALEMRAKSRSSAAIKSLLELQARTARVIRDGSEVDVPVEEVVVGDTVLVRPGEKVPVDGLILEGESAIDESVVTGESVPVDKGAGDQVIGSSVNKTGAFTFRATAI